MSSTITITLAPEDRQPTQEEWDSFCHANGMRLAPSGNGYFYSKRVKAGCNRNVATFTTLYPILGLDEALREAARMAGIFWARYGGQMVADPELRVLVMEQYLVASA